MKQYLLKANGDPAVEHDPGDGGVCERTDQRIFPLGLKVPCAPK